MGIADHTRDGGEADNGEVARPVKAVDAVTVRISPGELVDRITVLEIKMARFIRPAKLVSVKQELASLKRVRDRCIPSTPDLDALAAELGLVNQSIWDAENEVRSCERDRRFNASFVRCARSIYLLNDKRCALKRQINELLGAELLEEKEYHVTSGSPQCRAVVPRSRKHGAKADIREGSGRPARRR